MPSIKRYAPHIAISWKNNIFRAIKVTDDNHHTIKLFAGDQVKFEKRITKNKSVIVDREIVLARTPNNHLKTAKNGDYICRQNDGKFILLGSVEFNRLYKETYIRIADE